MGPGPDSGSNGRHVSPSAAPPPASDADDLLKLLHSNNDTTSNTKVLRSAQETKPMSLVISVDDLGPGKSYPLRRVDCENVFRQFGIVTDFVATGDSAARVYFQTAAQAEQVQEKTSDSKFQTFFIYWISCLKNTRLIIFYFVFFKNISHLNYFEVFIFQIVLALGRKKFTRARVTKSW